MAEKLKEILLTESSVNAMAETLGHFFPDFKRKRFVALVFDEQYDRLELKARMRHITVCLRRTLPGSYRKALGILEKAASQIKGFEAMCLPDFVELYGLDDWDISLGALALFTRYSSSEFAIRPFIIKDPKRAMIFMEKLTRDKDPNVRRFASEGCRPRLPWAMAIPPFKKDPRLILPVLEKLKDDNSEFVRRSVANNLNDISKDNAELVLDICEKWGGKSGKTDWIIKHACRTLLKAGNTRAMLLFGFGNPENIRVDGLTLDRNRLAIGEKVQFSFSLQVDAEGEKKVRLEYAVGFVKARAKISRKIFKITENTFSPGEHQLTRRHSFADMSTRKHYPGKHQIVIFVNGVEKARVELMLAG